MKKTIMVRGFANNYRDEPRVPLVTISGFDREGAELSALAFDPEHAVAIASALVAAALLAARNQNFSKEIEVTEQVR